MSAKLRTAVLSALIGLGAITAMPAIAQAEGVYLNYGTGLPAFGEYDRVDYRHGPRYDRRDYRGCTPQHAVRKAERYGVRRARVVDVDRRTITVAGRKWDRRIHMTFSRAPNCPLLGR